MSAFGHRLVMAHGGLEAARATVEHLLGVVPVPLHVARSG